MAAFTTIDDEIEIVPVPMDRETRRRLVAFARATGDEPADLAAILMRDLLADDALFNAAAEDARERANLN